MDDIFLKKVLETPSCSRFEDRMIEFIEEFCISNGIEYETKDNNIYLTKGKLAIDQYYPCFTAHLDTVHHKQIPFVIKNEKIPIKEEILSTGDIAYTSPNIGIGGDDKCGIAIILDILLQTPVCKAVFFWGEEIGGQGSRYFADLDFFNNVGWICGFDSPEFNRAAISCKGNRLFSREFFKKYLKENMKNMGIDNWRYEPGTDVMILREKLNLQMMNFGSGYWKQHTEQEYVVLNEVSNAVLVGLKLIEILGYNQYPFTKKKPIFSYLKWGLKRVFRSWIKENL